MLEKVTAGEVVRDIIASMRARTAVSELLVGILARVRDLLDASEAYLMLIEGRQLRLHAASGLPAGATGTTLTLGEGLEGMAAEIGDAVTVPDAARHPRFRDPFARRQPVGAMAVVPVVLPGRVTGVIAVTRQRPGQFGGSNLWWLDVLGALAALAIEDDRLYRAQERRARQAEVLSQISSQAGVDDSSLLPRLTDALSRALGVSRIDLLLADAEEGELVSCGLGCGVQAEGLMGRIEKLPIAGGGPLADVFTTGQPFICNGAASAPEVCRIFGDASVHSLLAVPILVSGRRRGVLYLAHDQPNLFTEDDLAFLSIIGARVGSLIETEDLRRRQLQVQRAEAEAQAKREFAGIVSHELKTPVAVIQAYTDLLLRRAEKTGVDANTDIVRRIAEQAERMLGLIDQMLDLQRIEAGMFRLELSRFDLVGLAGWLVEETQTTTRQHHLAVAADGPVTVSADRRRIEQVLQNLVDNAIKYSPDGGDIRISVRLIGRQGRDEAVVAVSDRGQGIPQAEQARVFERFYQGGDRLQRGHVGLGLGLYISSEIVRRHGGEMWLESNQGEGSVFYFSLPATGPEED